MADALILHSEQNRQQLVRWIPAVAEKANVIPHGNYDEFRNLEMSRERARQRLELPDDRKIVLFFGAIREYKGLDLLLQTVGPVTSSCDSALFVVAGLASRVLESAYRTQAEELKIPPESLLLRFGYLTTEDAIAYVCASDLVVLPYQEIYQSGVLFWAYSFSRPVVATRVGSFEESIDDGKSGWLVDKDDVNGLAAALTAALGDSEKLATAGRYARNLADRYDWNGIAQRTVQLYERVCA